MQKLIKLSDTHYIVVDDSEIKVNDWVYSMDGVHQWFGLVLTTEPLPKKITHSTEPLEMQKMNSLGSHFAFVKIKELFLSEVEEAIHGYSVEKMAENFADYAMQEMQWASRMKRCTISSYIEGFKAHQELVKDKLFTIEDMQLAFAKGNDYAHKPYPQNVQFENEYKQSLLPKTEWDVIFDEQGKIKLI